MADCNEITDAVRAVLENKPPGIDIIDISEILRNHKCFYLLDMLAKTGIVNEYTAATVNDMAYNKILITERYKTCAPVFDAMEAEEAPYAVIKGAVLSQAAYGDIIYRKSADIDLLAGRNNIDKLSDIMRSNGFIQGRITDDGIKTFTRQEILFHSSLSHQIAPFVKKTDNVLCPYVKADVNTDVLWGESRIKADMDYILCNTVKINICGVTVRKLSPVMEFISLCLHHYKDMNSIYLLSLGSMKLYLFCDIYFYLLNNDVSITELIMECDKLHVAEYIYYCVYYANMIFDDIKLSEYISVLENERGKSILDTFGLDGTEKKSWNISFCERLFSEQFYEEFSKLLNEKDNEKINKNKFFM